jgi:hypothetical protein
VNLITSFWRRQNVSGSILILDQLSGDGFLNADKSVSVKTNPTHGWVIALVQSTLLAQNNVNTPNAEVPTLPSAKTNKHGLS